jgi:hypothetical protein
MTKPKRYPVIDFDPPVSRIPTETYRGEKAIPVRPGSDDAFRLKSLQNGELVDRAPPVSIASKVSQLRKYP